MFTKATLAEARAHADRALTEVRAQKTAPPKPIAPAVATLEATGMACALGVADGRRGGPADAGHGVSPALLLGTALHAFALFRDDGDRLAQHAQALGNGALAACAYQTGLQGGRAASGGALPAREVEPRPPRSGQRIELTVARLSVTSWP